MDDMTRQTMDLGGVADITTIGRKTGNPHRIEINFQQLDGSYYLIGMPTRPRDWKANILAHPEFTLHLKEGVVADVPVIGEPEPDDRERGRVIRLIRQGWGRDPVEIEASLQKWVDDAPFIRFAPVPS
jgi:deazaflavin-dependent oxidoreductase (nitroreductase family)